MTNDVHGMFMNIVYQYIVIKKPNLSPDLAQTDCLANVQHTRDLGILSTNYQLTNCSS